jgi:hypothetical protein
MPGERRTVMSLNKVVIEETLKPDGKLEPDQKPGLAPGRVKVTLCNPPRPARLASATWRT